VHIWSSGLRFSGLIHELSYILLLTHRAKRNNWLCFSRFLSTLGDTLFRGRETFVARYNFWQGIFFSAGTTILSSPFSMDCGWRWKTLSWITFNIQRRANIGPSPESLATISYLFQSFYWNSLTSSNVTFPSSFFDWITPNCLIIGPGQITGGFWILFPYRKVVFYGIRFHLTRL